MTKGHCFGVKAVSGKQNKTKPKKQLKVKIRYNSTPSGIMDLKTNFSPKEFLTHRLVSLVLLP